METVKNKKKIIKNRKKRNKKYNVRSVCPWSGGKVIKLRA